MNYNLTIKITAIIAIATALVYTGLHFGQAQQTNAYYQGIKDSAYEICNTSRINNTISESSCAAFLDANKLDFVCEANNSLTTNHCQVEDVSAAYATK